MSGGGGGREELSGDYVDSKQRGEKERARNNGMGFVLCSGSVM